MVVRPPALLGPFVFLALLAAVPAAQNLVRNANFENGELFWEFVPGARIVAVGTGAYNGSHVLELDVPAAGVAGAALQDLQLAPGAEYEFSYSYQRSFAELNLRIPFTLGGYSPYNMIARALMRLPAVPVASPLVTGWTRSTIRFFAAEDVSTLQIGPINYQLVIQDVPGGKVWIDGLTVFELGTCRQAGIDHEFVATLPSEATVGQSVELSIYCMDSRGSQSSLSTRKMPVLADTTLALSGAVPSSLPSTLVFDQSSQEVVDVRFETPGVYRIKLEHPNGTTFLSNPIRVTATVPPTRHFWGDIHIHTEFQHAGWGGGDGFDNLKFARQRARLDFAALSEHYPSYVGPYYIREMANATRRHYDPGKFVTLYAIERASFPGHYNTYLRTGDRYAMVDPRNQHTRIEDQLAFFRRTGTKALAIPHHFSLLDPADWRGTNRDARPLAELYSSHGSSELAGGWWRHPTQVGQDYSDVSGTKGHDLLTALERGHRIGVIGSSDDHEARPGFEGLTCALAPVLDRPTVWDTLQARRCYATSGARPIIDFAINGIGVGDEGFELTGASLTGHLQVHGSAVIDRIEVVSDGSVVDTLFPGVLDYVNPALDLGVFDGTSTWFYLRIFQADEHRAWTSPIWMSPASVPDLCLEAKDVDYDYANLRLVVRPKNYGDASASTAVRVFASVSSPHALQTLDLSGGLGGVVTRVEPLGGDRSLIRIYMHLPESSNDTVDFSGQIQISGSQGYSIVTDPRKMLVDNGNGTITWNEGPYGLMSSNNGQSWHSGRITDFELLVHTGPGTTLTCNYFQDGLPVPNCYLGNMLSAVAGMVTTTLDFETSTQVAEQFVVVPPGGASVELAFPGLLPGRTYVVSIDPDDAIAESEERNNSIAWKVSSSPPFTFDWPAPPVRESFTQSR